MKKILAFSLLAVTVFLCVGCTFTPKTPTHGIWYCEELGISIEFYIDPLYSSEFPRISARLSDNEGGYQKLESHWQGNWMEFYIRDVDGEVHSIYSGYYKYKNEQFTMDTISRGDPADNYKTQIKPDGETYTFVRLECYTEIKR